MTAPEPGHDGADPLSQVRHDLKTPINQIIGYSEMLAEDAEDKSVLADLEKITAAAKTLLEITGWAQVNGWRGNTSLEKRIEYDLYYIENWSVTLDIKIMWLTLIRVLTPNRGAA